MSKSLRKIALRTQCIGVLCTLSVSALLAQYSEPERGIYPTNLVIYQDALRKGVTIEKTNAEYSNDNSIKYRGASSLRFDVRNNATVNVFWGGRTLDTTVFWLHDFSHLSFWVRPSDERLKFSIDVGYMDRQFAVIEKRDVSTALTWRYYDVIVPASAVRRPLNNIKITIWSEAAIAGSIHFDDIKLSNVRIYAGRGVANSISGVFADQLGYDTRGIKTFSAEKFSSFQLLRVPENSVAYGGKNPRVIESPVVNDYAVYVSDFTAFQTPGRYVIRLDNGKTSHPFVIADTVYEARLRAALRFLYYQRNNSAIEMPYAEGPWIHPKDEKEHVTFPGSEEGETKLVRKGWHDAGDLAIYMPNHTYTCYWLASAWDDFRFDADNLNIPESGNGVADILDELRWGLDWILDMQDTTDGGFYSNMCVQKNSPYAYGSTTPLTITGYELTNKTTSASASASGVLAYASTIFSHINPAYAARMLRAATQGWKFLEANPQQIDITINCTTYQDADDIHARFFASAGLFIATGEERFNRYFLSNDPGSQWISDYNNQTNLAYLLYLKSNGGSSVKKQELRALLTGRSQETNRDRENHPFGFAGYYYWGSLATAFARAGNYSLFDWKTNANESSIFTALQQLHYTFGQNSLGFVYVSGFGANGMKQGFHHWLKALNATPRNFPGMLAGGPNEKPDENDRSGENGYNKSAETPIDQRYTDNDSWSTNEVAVNQNAQLVYVLCAAQAYASGKK